MMLKKSIFCLLFLAVAAEATIHTKSCGGCTLYSVDDGNSMSWDEANVYCQRNGGNLVKIEHQLQQQCIKEFLNEIGDSGRTVWAGLRKVDGEWRWSVDNTLASSGFQNWYSGEPSGDGPFMHLWAPYSHGWNDVANSVQSYPLCEKCVQRNYCSGN